MYDIILIWVLYGYLYGYYYLYAASNCWKCSFSQFFFQVIFVIEMAIIRHCYSLNSFFSFQVARDINKTVFLVISKVILFFAQLPSSHLAVLDVFLLYRFFEKPIFPPVFLPKPGRPHRNPLNGLFITFHLFFMSHYDTGLYFFWVRQRNISLQSHFWLNKQFVIPNPYCDTTVLHSGFSQEGGGVKKLTCLFRLIESFHNSLHIFISS